MSEAHIIVYHNYAPDVANNPQIQGAIKNSGADEAVSIYTGARPLIQAIYRFLGRK